jgi:threonine synthase
VVDEVNSFGAEAVVLDPALGDGSVLEVLEQLHTKHSWFISNRNAPLPETRRFGNPFGLEDYKTIAYEIWLQLGGDLPEWCFVPVGGGDGFAGIWRGFLDLRQLGLATRVPRMVACQPDAGASLVVAVRDNLDLVPRVATSATIALSLVDERSSELSLRAIRESSGTAVAVSDDELHRELQVLGGCGISLEPSSAAAFAALRKLVAAGTVPRNDRALVLATGAGLRWPASFDRFKGSARKVAAPNVGALTEVVAV